MPLYEFYNQETRTRILVQRKVEERNKPLAFVRITVPSTISIHGFEPSPAEDFDQTILKKFHRQEEKEGSRFRCGEFTKQQIRDAWTGRTSPIKEDYPHGE